jgi:hypothetical protein
MKKLSILLLVFALHCLTISAQIRCPRGSVAVRGHVTKRGKVVKPHCRTRRDGNKRNNWSTKGNRNPVTGRRGRIKM